MKLCGAWARLLAMLSLACLLSASNSFAQTGTASLYGKVTDQQGAVLPGVTVTVTSTAAAVTRSTVSDGTGNYQFLALPPGLYSIKVELTGFRTATRDSVELPVDVRTKMDVPMEIGAQTETIEVTSVISPLNTTDASLGNTISGRQVAALPLEARNVVGLLSLQPGAVYLPNTANTDPRSGSVSGSRADQSNVTLDGVDVNDPQFGTAYSSALRVTTDALQEFRVTTSNYGADTGRSSAAQVSLVTKSGTNDFHGSATYAERDTKFSSKEYFLGLSGQDKAKLDKKIGGGAVGGPILRDKLFFFGNYERLQESSESPVLRGVPSDSMRDGVLIYGCDDRWRLPGDQRAGLHGGARRARGLSRSDAGRADRDRPASPGAEQGRVGHLQEVSAARTIRASTATTSSASVLRRRSRTGSTPTSAASTTAASAGQSFFGRFNFQDDAVVEASAVPGPGPEQHAEGQEPRLRDRPRLGALVEQDQHAALRLHGHRRGQHRAADREPRSASGSSTTSTRSRRPSAARRRPTTSWTTSAGSRGRTRSSSGRTCASRACRGTTTRSRSTTASPTRRGWRASDATMRPATRARGRRPPARRCQPSPRHSRRPSRTRSRR